MSLQSSKMPRLIDKHIAQEAEKEAEKKGEQLEKVEAKLLKIRKHK